MVAHRLVVWKKRKEHGTPLPPPEQHTKLDVTKSNSD